MKLIYVGDGSAFPDVPARDLTDEEVEKHGAERLIASGLYRAANPPVQRPAVRDEE